jgi:hypothetical protein
MLEGRRYRGAKIKRQKQTEINNCISKSYFLKVLLIEKLQIILHGIVLSV